MAWPVKAHGPGRPTPARLWASKPAYGPAHEARGHLILPELA
jgi:hypothetical protein